MKIISISQYRDALVNAGLSANQVRVLKLLYESPNSTATAIDLAKQIDVNLPAPIKASGAIGKTGKKICLYLNIDPGTYDDGRITRPAYFYAIGSYETEEGWKMWKNLQKAIELEFYSVRSSSRAADERKFTKQKIAISYGVAKKVYEKDISVDIGVKEMVGYGINEGSAKMILNHIFPRMMNGDEFSRTLSAPFFEYLFEQILKDYGASQLMTVLTAVKKHIEYIKDKRDAKRSLRIIYDKYLKIAKDKVADTKPDEQEIDEIEEYLVKHTTKEQVIEELKNLKSSEPEIVVINHKAYKRDNKTIAQLKFVRDFTCQICNTTIMKKDGSKYIEAAHIDPKHNAGKETPDNILVLCPNHHKEFDYGERVVAFHDKNRIDFSLNGNTYSIKLSL